MTLSCCLCACVSALLLLGSGSAARQRLAKHISAETNTHATIEELLDVTFFMRSVSYQGKVGD
jgi:hypothetical protein